MDTVGDQQQLPERLSAEDEEQFKAMVKVGYYVSSPKDESHNCIAYAAGDKTRKWDPSSDLNPRMYWPPGASRGSSLESLKTAFELIGYSVCNNDDLEEGFEKVAIYANKNFHWTHASRQRDNGYWTSKLGEEEDVTHKTPHCFGDMHYGDVYYILKRPRQLEKLNEEQEATTQNQNKEAESKALE